MAIPGGVSGALHVGRSTRGRRRAFFCPEAEPLAWRGGSAEGRDPNHPHDSLKARFRVPSSPRP